MESTLDPSNDDELDRRILDHHKQTIFASSEQNWQLAKLFNPFLTLLLQF